MIQKKKLRRAEPVRTLFQGLLREKLKTRRSKEELASFLGLSVAAIEAMLYQGQGGLDSWINAMLFCYGLEEESLPIVLSQLVFAFHQSLGQTSVDKKWTSLQSELNDNEKLFWIRLIETSKGSNYKVELPEQVKKSPDESVGGGSEKKKT